MSKIDDLTGRKFGKLTAVEMLRDESRPKGLSKIMWKCLCDCGNQIIVKNGNILKSGNTKTLDIFL